MTSPKPERTGVFVSCVTAEFEDAGSAYPGLRTSLRRYLARFNCLVQEDFPQVPVGLVEKLDELVRERAVVHLVGEKPGAKANPTAVAAFLKAVPDFLDHLPAVKAALGDFSDLTYTQWEAFIALHRGAALFVYATEGGKAAQKTHLERLRLVGRHATPIEDRTDLFGKLIGDIGTIVASVPKLKRELASSKLTRHAARNFFGREAELELLDRAWSDDGVHVLSVVAWGGVGKTSLVTQWVATRFAAKGWPGVERYFDWSFYSQGTGDSRQTSSDLFVHTALTFFGDPNPLAGSTWERGERLARLVRETRTLLILDGVEPLQYPPTDRSGQAGRLKDQGLEALLQGLAQDNNGLCVVTTREHLANIESYPTQKEHKLEKLMLEAAVLLIRHLQLVGTDDEIAAMWDQLDGHALSILQLGRLLARAYGKDLVKWREIGFEDADKLGQGRSTMRVMRRYEEWMRSESKEQQLELAVLRLMGLFDRPMSADCFRALRQPPSIPGLTDLFAGVKDFEVEGAITTLIENDLMSHGEGDAPGLHLTHPLDAHPLIREYFAIQLKQDQPAAFTAAHSRLFDFLCENTPHRPDTLDELQPLYQAVVHGCLAGRHQEACDKVYVDRILRGAEYGGYYSTKQLGASGADLAAVAAFFDDPWATVSPNLTEPEMAWLLGYAAGRLHALGRLTEALQPIRACLEMRVRQGNWMNAAICASNLSELEVALGRLAAAVTDSRQAAAHADRSSDPFQRIVRRAVAADAVHQSGQWAEAGVLFTDADRMQKEWQPHFGLLYSLQGFQYCDWLLAPAERCVWQAVLPGNRGLPEENSQGSDDPAAICDAVEYRVSAVFGWRRGPIWNPKADSMFDIALDNLTLARVGLIRAILSHPLPQPTLDVPPVQAAVNGLRDSGQVDELPRGLLTAALYHFVRGEHADARARLNEAEQIAKRGPMPLFLADVHLHRARMFRDRGELAKAAKLIRDLGYGRRYDELADAEDAAKNWPA